MNGRNLKRESALAAVAALLAVALCGSARADVVTEWNQNAQQALLTAKTSPIASSRALAIVQVSVFDAVNAVMICSPRQLDRSATGNCGRATTARAGGE